MTVSMTNPMQLNIIWIILCVCLNYYLSYLYRVCVALCLWFGQLSSVCWSCLCNCLSRIVCKVDESINVIHHHYCVSINQILNKCNNNNNHNEQVLSWAHNHYLLPLSLHLESSYGIVVPPFLSSRIVSSYLLSQSCPLSFTDLCFAAHCLACICNYTIWTIYLYPIDIIDKLLNSS